MDFPLAIFTVVTGSESVLSRSEVSTSLTIALARSESTDSNCCNTRSGKVTNTARRGSSNLGGRPPCFFSILDVTVIYNMNTRIFFGFYIINLFNATQKLLQSAYARAARTVKEKLLNNQRDRIPQPLKTAKGSSATSLDRQPLPFADYVEASVKELKSESFRAEAVLPRVPYRHAPGVLLFLALAILAITWPWVQSFPSAFLAHWDPPFHAWKLELVARTLLSGHLLPHDGNTNMYYPHSGALYFEALHWPQALVAPPGSTMSTTSRPPPFP